VQLWPKMSGHLRRETSEILGMIQRIGDEHTFLAKLASAEARSWAASKYHSLPCHAGCGGHF
jgi:hypothetical protein